MKNETSEPPIRYSKRTVRWITRLALIAFLGVLWLAANAQGGEEASIKGVPVWASLIVLLILVACKAFFAISETSLVSVRRTRVKQLVDEKKRGAKRLEHLLQNPPRFLATAQIGIEIVSAFASVLGATALAGPFVNVLDRTGLLQDPSQKGIVKTIAIIIITLFVALLNITIGEILPKSIGFAHPETYALKFAGAMDRLAGAMGWLVAIVTGITNPLVKKFGGGHAHFASPVISEEELKVIVESSEEHGVLEEEETEIIKSVFEFTDTIAREVMTPRIDLIAAEVNTSVMDIVKMIGETGYSRIPVFQENIDHVVGIVHAKDLLAKLNGDEPNFSLKDVIRPVLSIPENKSVVELLREMRQSRAPIAVVRDEYGGTAGLVTIEDLVEELVGDIMDEYDEEDPMVHTVQDDVYLVDGRMHIDDLNDQLDLHLESAEFDTVGGLVFGLFGHQPEPGEQIAADSVCFIVHQTDGRRIQKVRVEKIPSSDEDDLEFEDT